MTVWSVVREITQPLNKKWQKKTKKKLMTNFQTKKNVTIVGISLKLRNFMKKVLLRKEEKKWFKKNLGKKIVNLFWQFFFLMKKVFFW